MLLWIGGLAGLLLVFLTPPGQGPDEPERLLRAFAVAEGDLQPRRSAESLGDEVPHSLVRSLAPLERLHFAAEQKTSVEEIGRLVRTPLDPENRSFVALPGMAALIPTSYLPAVAGAWVGRLVELPPVGILWLARVADLAVGLALAWAAVRIAPVARWLFAVLALTPMALFLRSTVSADVTTFGVALLWVGVVLHAREGDGPPRLGWLVALAACLGLVKFAYAQLALLILIVPAERCGGSIAARRLRFAVLAAALAGATISAVWALHFADEPRPGVAVDATAQLEAVIADPLRFTSLVARDVILNGPRYGAELVGNLGWLDTRLPNPLRLLYALLLVALAVVDGPRTLRAGDRVLVLGLVVLTVTLIAFTVYLAWTPVGANEIEGIQGRYYLPLVPTAALVMARPRSHRTVDDAPGWIVVTIVAASTATTIVTVVLRYYV